MPGKKMKNGQGLEIGGNIYISHGDFVTGDKNVHVEGGDVVIGGDVQSSNIIIGSHNQVSNQVFARDTLFEELIKKIEQRPDTSPEDKENLEANVKGVEVEAAKGEHADETLLSGRLVNIQRIAPDIAEVVLATLMNPVAGFAKLVQEVAERAQKSATT